MDAAASEVSGLEVEGIEGAEIFAAYAREFIEKLGEGFALTVFVLGKAVKGVKVFDSPCSRMMRARGIQSVSSPWMRWPTTS